MRFTLCDPVASVVKVFVAQELNHPPDFRLGSTGGHLSNLISIPRV